MRAEIQQWTQRAWGAALDFCFPNVCLFCEKREPQLAGNRFCKECSSICRLLAPNQCQHCAAPLGPFVDSTRPCLHCQDESYSFDSACCLGPYRDPLRSAVLRAKLNGGHALTCDLTDQLWTRQRESLISRQIDLVIPVPHLWSEQLWRQHLTPITITERISGHLGIPAGLELLSKIKRTPKQALLPKTSRRENQRGAFAVTRGTKFFQTRILLVDDILTTGATCHECAKVLKQAGAGEVHVAVIGRVV